MKFVSGVSALFALSMFLNAIDGVWALDRVSTGTKWVILDVAIGVGLLFVSYTTWRMAANREVLAAYEAYRNDEEAPAKPRFLELTPRTDRGLEIIAEAAERLGRTSDGIELGQPFRLSNYSLDPVPVPLDVAVGILEQVAPGWSEHVTVGERGLGPEASV